MIMTLSLTQYLLMNAQSIYEMPSVYFLSIKLSVNICFQKLPLLTFLLPPLMAAAGYGPDGVSTETSRPVSSGVISIKRPSVLSCCYLYDNGEVLLAWDAPDGG